MNSLHWAYVMWVTTYPWSFSDLLSMRASIPWRAKLQLKSWRLADLPLATFLFFLGGLQCFFCADLCFKGNSYPTNDSRYHVLPIWCHFWGCEFIHFQGWIFFNA